jgi:hypothetical protein
MSDIPPPITKIDGGPQQFNSEAYHYDGDQPVTKPALPANQDARVSPAVRTDTRGDQQTGKTIDPAAVRQGEPTTIVRTGTEALDVSNNARGRRTGQGRNSSQGPSTDQGTSTGNCSTVNYGDAGSGAHDHDSWRPGADRSHAKQGSLAEKWWQGQANLPADIKTDNGLYTVQFADCIETIAKRELVTEGKSVTRQSLKQEIDLIVRLNDCHYKSLDNNRDYLMTGWKLILRDDSAQNTQLSPPSTATDEAAGDRTRRNLPNPSTSDNYYGTAPQPLDPQARIRDNPQARTREAHLPHYTAISLPNPQSHIQFTPATGPRAGQKIDVRAGLQPNDVLLYHEKGALPRVIYQGPNNHRPPTKQIYDDGTIGPVIDPEFVAWTNDYNQQSNGYVPRVEQRNRPQYQRREGQRSYSPDPEQIERQSRNYSPPDNTPAPLSAPERHTFTGPIPHYTAVAWTPQKPIQFFTPAVGHVDNKGAYVTDKAAEQIDVTQADNLQSTDAVLVHEGSLAKIYYLGGRVENRPPNKEIYADGTAGGIKDQNFVEWSKSYYGTAAAIAIKPVVRPNPVPTAKLTAPETAQVINAPPANQEVVSSKPVAATMPVKPEVPAKLLPSSPAVVAPKDVNKPSLADAELDAP